MAKKTKKSIFNKRVVKRVDGGFFKQTYRTYGYNEATDTVSLKPIPGDGSRINGFPVKYIRFLDQEPVTVDDEPNLNSVISDPSTDDLNFNSIVE